MTSLSETQRRAVFNKVVALVDTKFMGADVDTGQLRESSPQPSAPQLPRRSKRRSTRS